MITKDKRRVKLLEPTSDPDADKLEQNLNSKSEPEIEEHNHSHHSCPHCDNDINLDEATQEAVATSNGVMNGIVEAVEDLENYDQAIWVYFSIAYGCIREGLRKAFEEPEIFGEVRDHKKNVRKAIFSLINSIPKRFEDEE